MKEITTKLLDIGGGPGGYVAAIRAGQLGVPTVLVEGESDDADWPLSARTEGNRLVRMKGDKSLIGTFTTAKISGSNTWALYGAAEETI